MRLLRHFARPAGAALILCASACRHDAAECLALPCPEPIAVMLTLTSSTTGGAVIGGVVQVDGPIRGTIQCGSTAGARCLIGGVSGTYSLTISAPGYATVQRTVQVPGTTPACGCATAETQTVDVTLTATG